MLTLEECLARWCYNPETGETRWVSDYGTRAKKGQLLTCRNGRRLRVLVDRVNCPLDFYLHLMMTGGYPKTRLMYFRDDDHLNYRWDNLVFDSHRSGAPVKASHYYSLEDAAGAVPVKGGANPPGAGKVVFKWCDLHQYPAQDTLAAMIEERDIVTDLLAIYVTAKGYGGKGADRAAGDYIEAYIRYRNKPVKTRYFYQGKFRAPSMVQTATEKWARENGGLVKTVGKTVPYEKQPVKIPGVASIILVNTVIKERSLLR